MTEEKKTNEQLVKEIQAGNDSLLETLIYVNMGLVNSFITKMAVYNHLTCEDEQDLQQVGMIKLMEAAKKYDASQNSLFVTYAVICIRGGMIDWIRENKSYIHIPNEMRKKCSEYKKAIEVFSVQNNGRQPSNRYLMKALSVTETELNTIRDALKAFKVDSIDDRIESEDDVISKSEIIEDKEDKYMKLLLVEDRSRMLGLILNLKNEKERKVIIDEYYNEISQVMIAEKMGVTAQRVQNLKREALKHLKELPEVKEMAKEYGIIVEQSDKNIKLFL